MLKLENVSTGYNNNFVVNNISLNVSKGEKLSIIGPNGCGKSTLLKSIVGLLKYTGKINIDNIDLKKIKRIDVAKKMAFMNQTSSVYFSYTVFETVMLGRYSKQLSFANSSKKDIDFVNRCIDAVNISHLCNRPITELSGGELQRVFLAKAFAQDPEILLLDEPTNHLDLKHQIQLIDYLKSWASNKDKIIISVFHDINLALSFADNILLMKDGKVSSYGTKKYILKNNCFDDVYGLNIKKYMKNLYNEWNV